LIVIRIWTKVILASEILSCASISRVHS